MDRRIPLLLVASLALAGSQAAAQDKPQAGAMRPAADAKAHSGTLTVSVDPAKAITLKADDLAAMTRTSVKVESDGQTVTYEGVLVAELLKRAGAPLGGQLRGDNVASYVVASASDGYRALFSLAE